MCGIFCTILNEPSCKISNITLDGLYKTQNRGYDSAGICVKQPNKLLTYKAINDDILPVDKLKTLNIKDTGMISISHTRWATHGHITYINSHPHLDNEGNFALVHNGIINNLHTIRKYLLSNDIQIKSVTDSELIVLLISHFYEQGNSVLESMGCVMKC